MSTLVGRWFPLSSSAAALLFKWTLLLLLTAQTKGAAVVHEQYFSPLLLNTSFTIKGEPLASSAIAIVPNRLDERQCFAACFQRNAEDIARPACNAVAVVRIAASTTALQCHLYNTGDFVLATVDTDLVDRAASTTNASVDVFIWNPLALAVLHLGSAQEEKYDSAMVSAYALASAQRQDFPNALALFAASVLLLDRMEREKFGGLPIAPDAPSAKMVGFGEQQVPMGGREDFINKFRAYTNIGVLLQQTTGAPSSWISAQLYE